MQADSGRQTVADSGLVSAYSLNIEEARYALSVDWRDDSKGDGSVCRTDFYDSVFELGLAWTESVGTEATLIEGVCALMLCYRSRCHSRRNLRVPAAFVSACH
jgi:hypothetical protein